MSRHRIRKSSRSAAPVFSALGDPTRLELISRLTDGQPRSISQLTKGQKVTRQAITRHLQTLEKAGILKSDSVGREIRYSFVPEAIRQARTYLDAVSVQWDDAIHRLKAFVESDRH